MIRRLTPGSTRIRCNRHLLSTYSNERKNYDFIIIGAGSAGCLLAKRLTENPAVQVLLLEAGGKDDYMWIHIPVGYLYCIDNPRTDWMFKTKASAGSYKILSIFYHRKTYIHLRHML